MAGRSKTNRHQLAKAVSRNRTLDHRGVRIVVSEEVSGLKSDRSPVKHYYAKERVGIACGLLIAAIQEMGLVSLTHTPSPMRFLDEILKRPTYERPFIRFPIRYPAKDAQVPNLQRKSFDETVKWIE